jgi:radical SAM superfamily enzyme YgiQ (UPF0313 family)
MYMVKKYFNLPVICGGFHSSMAPEQVISQPCFDIVVTGEGDYTILEILDHYSGKKNLEEIDGIWFRKNGEIIRNKIRPFNSSIEDLPFPDRGLFDYQRYIHITGAWNLYLVVCCPHECSYCINKAMMDKSAKNIL